ncbi:hypothetical protein OMAG_001160 [Candidatus Omnitrophus magneticus]|uniref:Uncharacterized protein n=1 Tax=Candidatus Omnitrophus magneticus TaxID=1609969 RepID=A0A0F0CU15_9BACT|nr:hypothetical protein OMAG_001160 [Candidatus Omnitrophus magneticus]
MCGKRWILDNKTLLREYIKKYRYFSLNNVVQSIGIKRCVAIKYLQLFKSEKIVFSAGRGFYTSEGREFIYPKISRVIKIRQLIIKEFPNLDFIIWNTLYFQPYYHHQQTHNITVVEVEYDGIQSVVEIISRFYRNVITESKRKLCTSEFDITNDPIIVRPFIRRSPRDGNEPRLEKMLVDIYIINYKYKIMADVDFWELWRSLFSLYRIDFSKLIDYAVGRRNMRVLISQLIDNAGLKEVIFDSKYDLLSNMTRKKGGRCRDGKTRHKTVGIIEKRNTI